MFSSWWISPFLEGLREFWLYKWKQFEQPKYCSWICEWCKMKWKLPMCQIVERSKARHPNRHFYFWTLVLLEGLKFLPNLMHTFLANASLLNSAKCITLKFRDPLAFITIISSSLEIKKSRRIHQLNCWTSAKSQIYNISGNRTVGWIEFRNSHLHRSTLPEVHCQKYRQMRMHSTRENTTATRLQQSPAHQSALFLYIVTDRHLQHTWYAKALHTAEIQTTGYWQEVLQIAETEDPKLILKLNETQVSRLSPLPCICIFRVYKP